MRMRHSSYSHLWRWHARSRMQRTLIMLIPGHGVCCSAVPCCMSVHAECQPSGGPNGKAKQQSRVSWFVHPLDERLHVRPYSETASCAETAACKLQWPGQTSWWHPESHFITRATCSAFVERQLLQSLCCSQVQGLRTRLTRPRAPADLERPWLRRLTVIAPAHHKLPSCLCR